MGREHTFDGGSVSGGSAGGDSAAGLSGLGSDPFGVTALVEGAATAVALDPSMESSETLMASAVALEDARNLLEGASARVLGELETSGACDVAVGMRTAGWLAWEADGSRVKCRSRVGVARRLGWFGLFDDAMVERRVTYAHVEVLCNVANVRNRDGLREAQQSLIDLAARFTFEDWCRLVRRLAADLDQDGSYDPNDDLDANRLKLSPRGDGTADLAGRLVGDAAATVGQTLESLADDLFHRFRRDAVADPTLPMPCRATLMALALAEACRRALATDVESSKAPGVEATVVIDTDDTGNPVVEDLAGNPISNRAAGALLVDPVVRAMVLDADGVPLRLGRKVRLATPDQRHALALRDRGCVFPGCDAAPGWCDAHHQPGWQHGGTTDIESMFLLCRHHHVVTHRAGWALDGDPERPQHWMWTTPTGRVLASQRQHPSQEHRRTRPG